MRGNSEAPAKVDRRVVRTRKAIMDAFDRLIVEKGFDKITVSAIAREANIDRKTFYLHYSSIEELAKRKTEQYLESILAAMKEHGATHSFPETLHNLLVEVNKLLTSQLDVFQHIASGISQERVIEALSHALRPALENSGLDSSAVENETILSRMQFYVAGGLSLYTSWLESDHSKPIESVSDIIEGAVTPSEATTAAYTRMYGLA